MAEVESLADCRWREPGGPAAARTICAFLATIGIAVEVAPLAGPSLVPGLAVHRGVVQVDPGGQAFPGDLLHEAGHIAVAHPDLRATLHEVGDDPGEEMAAIAWSVAAARACGISLEVLFHPEGYKGGADSMIAAFDGGGGPGVPLLGWYGMTGEAGFPAMSRWLR